MATSKDSPAIKVAADAARHFVDRFYPALNDSRASLSSYYHSNAAIVWNGNPITGGEAFSTFFTTMPTAFYDVQSFDAHPLPSDRMGGCSIMLMVSGAVKYGESKEQKGFSETFVLRSEQGRPTKFKISAQGFRLVTA